MKKYLDRYSDVLNKIDVLKADLKLIEVEVSQEKGVNKTHFRKIAKQYHNDSIDEMVADNDRLNALAKHYQKVAF